MPPSIRRRLLASVLAPLLAIIAVQMALDYEHARTTADFVYDDALLSSAHTIAEQVSQHDGNIEAIIPPAALERLGRPSGDRVAYRVDGPNDELLAGYPDTPLRPGPDSYFEPHWYDASFRSQPMRLVTLRQPLSGTNQTARVTIGETLQARSALASNLLHRDILDDSVLFAMTALLVVGGLRFGLGPIMRLRKTISTRRENSLEPLDMAPVPRELRPLVGALNEALGRATHEIRHRERLLADSAHQIRTPLAVLRTQSAIGLERSDGIGKDAILHEIVRTVSSMERSANQLLALARVEGHAFELTIEHVDLTLLCQRVLIEMAPSALDRNVEISLSSPEGPVLVRGNEILLEELLRNVVDNALRHATHGGIAAVEIVRNGETVSMTVVDNGDGIQPEFRDRAFDRFYRVPGTVSSGSGLGLAIVREIAALHAGTVSLENSPTGSGLCVRIVLPAAN